MAGELVKNNGFRLSRIVGLVFVLLIPMGFAEAQMPLGNVLNGQTPSACRAGMRVYESDRGKQLLGEVIEADFPRLLPGWNAEASTYEPAAEDVATLAEVPEDIDIICILGTWCHDSQREVPRFWKILQEVGNPHLDLTMFAVGRSSDEEARSIMDNIGFDEPLRETYRVELVPTFIFMNDGEELGRIIESPVTTLEQEAARILSSGKSGITGLKPAWN
jgi:thiol-disulfide isomerase/thioredoxin